LQTSLSQTLSFAARMDGRATEQNQSTIYDIYDSTIDRVTSLFSMQTHSSDWHNTSVGRTF